MGVKHVHGSTTSLNGSKVDIDGDVEYSIIPLRINGFHGVKEERVNSGPAPNVGCRS